MGCSIAKKAADAGATRRKSLPRSLEVDFDIAAMEEKPRTGSEWFQEGPCSRSGWWTRT